MIMACACLSSAAEERNRVALVALYTETGAAKWKTRTNWLSAQPLGKWYGVTTDASGQVTELSLDSNKIVIN